MSQIFWIASYPKSGNTWMRVFLTNYWRNASEPVNINELEETRSGDVRLLFDDMLSIDTSLFSHEEADQFRPAVYRKLAAKDKSGHLFFKIHDAYQRLPDGQALFPEAATSGVIYIVRNPLDVAVSYAHHNHRTIDQSIEWMGQNDHALFMARTSFTNQFRQIMFSWSNHLLSWVDESPSRLHLVRYEDMVLQTEKTFANVIEFIGGAVEANRLQRAIRFSSFDELKQQEQRYGFHEKGQYTEKFFRKGKIGAWRDELTPAQADRLVHDHSAVMTRLGYLTADGQLTY